MDNDKLLPVYQTIQHIINWNLAIMGITLTITAFLLTIIFGSIGYFEKIKPDGKLSTGTIINITFFILLMITGITDIIFKDAGASNDKKEIMHRFDSTTEELNKKIDTVIKDIRSEGVV